MLLLKQDAEELGVIFIGTESNGYSVKECVPKHTRGNKWKCGIMVQTPERQFVFMCEQEREQKQWLNVLRKVLSRPMSPQDYSGKRRRPGMCLRSTEQIVPELMMLTGSEEETQN